MSRVVNTDSPGKRRNQHLRSCAELIRHLSQKQEMDAEARDMLAAMIFILREIDDGLAESSVAWEKRDYWIKVEKFRERWLWVGINAAKLENLVVNEKWDQVPMQLMELMPNFSDIKVVKFTRDAILWEGMYKRLLAERNA